MCRLINGSEHTTPNKSDEKRTQKFHLKNIFRKFCEICELRVIEIAVEN